jgi:PAS domain S-box-containing protein
MASPNQGPAAQPTPESLLDKIQEALVALDYRFRITFLNRAAAELSGVPAGLSLGKTLPEVFPQIFTIAFETELHQLAADSPRQRFEKHIPGADRWLEADACHSNDGLVLTIRDITDQKRAVRELETKSAQLELLSELAAAVSRAREPIEIYRAAVEGLVRAVRADRASVLMFDSDDVMRFKAWTQLSEEYQAAVEGHTPWRRGDRDAQPITVADVTRDPALAAFHRALAREGIRAVAFIPLMGAGGLIGKFMLYCDTPHEFRASEIQLAQAIATHVALAAERRQTETALRESEERFRAIFTQAAVGIALNNAAGEWVLVNDRYCEILGYTQDELRGKTFLDVSHPDDRESCLSVYHRFLAGELTSWTAEKRYIRKNGSIVWGRLCLSMAPDQTGRLQWFISVVEDITGRVQAEQALRDSQRTLLLAQSAAQLGVWDCDLRTNTTATSGEYMQIHGLPPNQQVLTHNEWLAMVHPADRDRVREQLRECLEKTHTWDSEFRIRWPDGSEHWLLGKGKVFVDDNGRPIRLAGVSLDITERKQAEAALLESEERFRKMADTAPVMLWVSGPDKLCTFFNKAWLDFTGRTLEQELGAGWADGIHPEDLDRCYASYYAAFDARRNFHIECRMRRADGEYRWVLCSGVPRFSPGGEFEGYVGSDTDITEVKRVQEQVMARQKLESLGVLTGGIAHDFNNLLGSILAEAELGETNLAAGVTPADELLRIKAVALRASEIVRELLIYSGQETANREPVDVSNVVAEMLELLKVSISKQAVLNIDLPACLPAVRANATQIRQVVMNLIINASEAIGDKAGVITVATSRVAGGRLLPSIEAKAVPDGDYLKLVVSDTGCGMTSEVQARIFDPFFTTKFAGRGLGLAVVQGIVRAHGGSLQLISGPGQGTTFEVLLPCADRPVEQFERSATPAPAENAAGGVGTILLVEDEDTLRLSVSKMLRKRGFTVIEAANGSTAIRHLRASKDKLDVILLDMTIPGCSSSEVIAEAASLRPEIKIILTTAYSREMAAPSLDTPQLAGFIRKPFQFGALVQLLRETLAS